MDNISAALRRIDLSDSEQAIYLSLLRQGRATPRLLSDRTGLTRPSVYDQLRKLRTLDLVVELEVDGKSVFAASEIKHLEALLVDKIDRLEQSRQLLIDSMSTLKNSLDTVVPKIKFFEGEDGMKQLMKDIMWHDHIRIIAFWNDEMMKRIYDDTFLRWWNERRLVRKIEIQWQVPVIHDLQQKRQSKKNKINVPDFFNKDTDNINKYKTGIEPTMTRLIYQQKVAHISSPKEAFGFIVESNEFSQLQQNV